MTNYLLISIRFLNILFNNFISKTLLSLVLLLLLNVSFIALPTFADQSANTPNNQYSDEEVERAIQISETAKSMKFTEEQAEEKALAEKLIASAEKLKRLKKEIEQQQQKIKKMEASNQGNTTITVTENLYGKEVEFIAKQKDKYGFKIGVVKAAQIIEKNGPEYQKYHKFYY